MILYFQSSSLGLKFTPFWNSIGKSCRQQFETRGILVEGGALQFAMCTHARPQKCKQGSFFWGWTWLVRIAIRGWIKKWLFSRKRVVYHFFPSNSMLLRGYFPTDSSLGGKIWLQNHAKFVFRGVFPSQWGILIWICFVNLWSCLFSHWKLECAVPPPPRIQDLS